VVEFLPTKHEALSLNYSTIKTKPKKPNKLELPSDPAIPVLDIATEEMKTESQFVYPCS
jgi:hypothetical protein